MIFSLVRPTYFVQNINSNKEEDMAGRYVCVPKLYGEYRWIKNEKQTTEGGE